MLNAPHALRLRQPSRLLDGAQRLVRDHGYGNRLGDLPQPVHVVAGDGLLDGRDPVHAHPLDRRRPPRRRRPGAVRVHAQVDVLAEHTAQQLERAEIALEVVADLDLDLPDPERADHERERDELARRRERNARRRSAPRRRARRRASAAPRCGSACRTRRGTRARARTARPGRGRRPTRRRPPGRSSGTAPASSTVAPSSAGASRSTSAAVALSTVSPVTYSRGTPSPQPTLPSASASRTRTFVDELRSARAWPNEKRKGSSTVRTSMWETKVISARSLSCAGRASLRGRPSISGARLRSRGCARTPGRGRTPCRSWPGGRTTLARFPGR